jgi:hypothetical protein
MKKGRTTSGKQVQIQEVPKTSKEVEKSKRRAART